MNHCKTCKWWHWDNPNNLTRCWCPKIVNDPVADEYDFVPDMARYGDYEGYTGWWEPGPEFGCVHHEEKEEAELCTN